MPNWTSPDRVAFVGVNVVSVDPDELRSDQTVLVQDGRIVRIAPAAEGTLPGDVQRIDGRGRFLAPGLADMHAHPFSAQDLAVYLAAGVTSIRSMWGEPSLLALRDEVEAGRLPGPRIHTAGRLVDGSPPHFFATTAVAEPADAARVVADNVAAGYDFVKVYEKLSLPVFDAIAAACKDQGADFAGHVPQAVPVAHAMCSGMRSAEHLFGYIPGVQLHPECVHLERWFIPGYMDAKQNFEAIGRGEMRLDDEVSDEKIQQLAALAARTGIWSTPTLVVLRAIAERTRYGPDDPLLACMPPPTRDYWLAAQKRRGATYSADFHRGWDAYYALNLRILRALHEAGAGILAGTDAPNPGVVTGFAMVDEIEYLAEAGLSPTAALRTATHDAAVYLRAAGERGCVREGALADLLLLAADPRHDTATLRQPLGVMARGAWRDRAALDALLDSVKAEYASRMQPFDDALPDDLPDNAPGGDRAWFRSSRGEHLLLHHDRSNGRSRAQWQGADGGAFQRMRTASAAEAGAAGVAPTLSGTPADLPLPWACGDLKVGESMTVQAAFSMLEAAPGTAPATPLHAPAKAAVVDWRLTRLDDAMVDSAFYYTGTRVYRLQPPVGSRLPPITVWIGGGFSEGEPVQLQCGDGEDSILWRRVK